MEVPRTRSGAERDPFDITATQQRGPWKMQDMAQLMEGCLAEGQGGRGQT